MTLGERMGHEFRDLDLLRQALQHPSFTHENPGTGPNNQRLEFLGDAALGLVVAEMLIMEYPAAREGELTRWRAALVSARPLASIARELRLGPCLLLGRGEDTNGGRDRGSLLCDAFEAVLGAVFLDGGLDAVRRVVEAVMGEQIRHIAEAGQIDPKSQLQECVQSFTMNTPEYRLVSAVGPEHAKHFEVEAWLDEMLLGKGEGSSKKIAEKAAARQALKYLRDREETS